ncbi:MAG: radical SAM protein [Candidatus Omnitrophica bacterium]|nr:radical SAM protein [Candidatus Omnitrophota bacterium]
MFPKPAPIIQTKAQQEYGLRQGAEEFPLQVIVSIIYPCNLGCPYCPYTDGNSLIRKFYREHHGEFIPPQLFKKIADECAPYKAFIRCTGGGEPTLHPHIVEMIEYAKRVQARVWLNTNGANLGPHSPKTKRNLEQLIDCGIDLMEFSVDAGDGETYDIVRPLRAGRVSGEEIEKRWKKITGTVRYAVQYRNRIHSPSKIVVSIINHDLIKDKIDSAADFWLNDAGVDEVIKRKYLTWDDNTSLSFDHAGDPNLYSAEKNYLPPCVWPFERMNVDTLGRVALCGQDIAFNTAPLFPNINEQSIKDVWQGEVFKRYREKHLAGRGDTIAPCGNCSAWKAGIRDWKHGWLKVLDTAEDRRCGVLKNSEAREVGMNTEIIRKNDPRKVS